VVDRGGRVVGEVLRDALIVEYEPRDITRAWGGRRTVISAKEVSKTDASQRG
jgi:hypothetical protein